MRERKGSDCIAIMPTILSPSLYYTCIVATAPRGPYIRVDQREDTGPLQHGTGVDEDAGGTAAKTQRCSIKRFEGGNAAASVFKENRNSFR